VLQTRVLHVLVAIFTVLARVAYRPNAYTITYLKLLDIVTDSRDNTYNLMPKIAAQNWHEYLGLKFRSCSSSSSQPGTYMPTTLYLQSSIAGWIFAVSKKLRQHGCTWEEHRARWAKFEMEFPKAKKLENIVE
jgi:hypothetical protein